MSMFMKINLLCRAIPALKHILRNEPCGVAVHKGNFVYTLYIRRHFGIEPMEICFDKFEDVWQ